MKRILAPLALVLAAAAAHPAMAQSGGAAPAGAPASPQSSFDWVRRADGARIVPERFLQPWDPITLFFDRDVGPARGGPEDDPGRLVSLAPDQAGAWQWIGPRALQFRPAEAWRPLRRVEIKAEGVSARLVPLLPAPVRTDPQARPDGIAELDQIALTFPGPVDPAALARLLTVEIRPLPGVSGREGQVLGAGDFAVKALERARLGDEQTYVVTLRQPVPDGRLAVVRLRLSDEPGLDDPSFELQLRTAVPFQVTELTCGRRLRRDLQDGVVRCAPYESSGSEEEGEAQRYQPGVRRTLALAFTGSPEWPDVARLREAVRVTPPVDDLAAETDGSRLRLSGRFRADTLYEMRVAPGSLKDARGRALEGAAFVQRFAFQADKPSLVFDAQQGVAERLGPQMIPLRGRGYDRADLRVHAIDPLSRDFWPFPADGLETSDAEAPALPGNEPKPWAEAESIEAAAMAERVKALGSPAVSEIVRLPIHRGGVEAKFGLDLKGHLARIAGPGQPGTYLVGLRNVDGGPRRWMRVQVTDLTLTAVEEAERVRFAVTSLADAAPVAGAEIRLEGVRDDRFVAIARGTTGPDGGFTWSLAKRQEGEIRRIVVTKGLDTLVVEPDRGPSEYHQENWSKPETPWLAWTTNPEEKRAEEARILCHVFTERPIYRPEEAVQVKGYVRRYLGGTLSYASVPGSLVIQGPSDQEWRYPVKLDPVGGFHHRFDAETPATGDYTARFEPQDGEACGSFPFKKEAYRLPTFEALLNGPQRAPLDAEFSVDLLARYFAGGLVANRPVKWRVTQFPYTWTPPGREGFLFSTDARYSGEARFRSTPVLEREVRTDDGGSARITLDPTVEPTAQPRRYSVEATVTGDDDVQVRATQSVVALPPFVLGVKVPRYIPDAPRIEAEVLALDAAGEPLPGLEMTLRLVKRNWNSVLQASDFSQGSAKYVTEVIDETLVERKVTSLKEAQAVAFEARGAGVYVLELQASDRIGRRQSVAVDFFVGGQTPVTWARPPAQNVQVAADKPDYAPGETATLVIQSPFQTARALAIVEDPSGTFRYDWVEIANGFGRYEVPVRKEAMPKLAVHFLVMRGRLPGQAASATAPFDQGKPVTVAATAWVAVRPVKHVVTASLEYPQRARPAQEVEVVLRLSDDTGKPVSGEATFWMVDQAVLSIAREQPLDPLPRFVVSRESRMAARDTRNMAFGIIPLEEVPGGDDTGDDWGIENISVRKNFTPVPVYLPRVQVGPDGTARIKVKLPDTLTVFKLRAKAISGPDRFGYATGEMMVRQELVAQPALPRFVRPGDRFEAGLIGRVVEGPGGTGRAALTVEGANPEGAAEQRFAWQPNRPARLDFPLAVAEPRPGAESMRLRFVLQRDADKAGDAVQVDLPVRPDRPPVRERRIAEVAPGGTLALPPPAATPRPGSYARTVTLASDPAVVRLVAGLNALVEYPYGCTEQRIALASSAVALKSFAPLLASAGLDKRLAADVRSTQAAIDRSVDEDGLVAFWPKARGNVSLTAWSYAFLVAAERSGESVDTALKDRLAKVLRQALRSDYGRLVAGEELRERVEALKALADGGQLEEAYVAELARRAPALPTASLAQTAAAVAALPSGDRETVAGLLDELWGRVRILSRDGRPVYAGLAGEGGNPVILPSEVRSLSEVTRAVAAAAPDEPRLAVLRDGLLRLGEGSGWGSTNADAAAIRALAASWRRPSSALPLVVTQGGAPERVAIDGELPLVRRVSSAPAALGVENKGGQPVVALVDTRYQPQEPGSRAQPVTEGFAVTRDLFRVPASGPPERLGPDADGAFRLAVGDVVEEVAEVVNPEDRTHVAIRLPLAAGLEPLNPNLATAPAEAAPSSGPTLQPTWVSFQDDHVLYAYDRLPKGNYRFVFRTRALIPGSFTQPPGEAETMYRPGVHGASAGARVVVGR